MKKKVYIEKRYNFLINLIQENSFTVGAEIGCERGNTTSQLLQRCHGLKLYAVDLWEWCPGCFTAFSKRIYKHWDFDEIKKTFDQQTKQYKDRVIVLQGISWEMAKHVEDRSLDFVFIDADHGYHSVKKDIIAWTPKLKDTGILSGHDINLKSVIKATSETIHQLQYGEDKCWYAKKEYVKI